MAASRLRRLAVLAAGALGLAGPASAEPGNWTPAFSDVQVDVRPLLAQGGGLPAEVLRADLTAALRRSLADRVGGRGPRLVVRVTGLSMRAYVAGNVGRGGLGGGNQSDYLEGEALLVDRGGAVIARHPQLSVMPSSYGGAWYDPDSERRRIAAIADIYAQWLGRELPGR